MALDEGFRADRLLGGHEVGDDRAQHLETTIIGATHAFTCLSRDVGVHFTVIISGDTARTPVGVADAAIAIAFAG